MSIDAYGSSGAVASATALRLVGGETTGPSEATALPSSSSDPDDDEDDELETPLSSTTRLAGFLSFFRITPVSGSASSSLELVDDDAGGLD